jgi:hypothetical protein
VRVVIVNHCHPETPHVCALRAREFAAALARRGHRIVLLTETLSQDAEAELQPALSDRLAMHDWRTPLRLACAPRGHAWLRRTRSGGFPAPLRKLTIAGYYGAVGTVFADWGRGAAPYLPILAASFRPQVVWATFGNTEALRIGRKLAVRAGCPWVLDVKDYWTAFITPPLRRPIGRRFADATAMTALSEGHVADSRGILPTRLTDTATVIYSGVPAALVAAGERQADINPERILLTGAIYETGWLDAILAGVARASELCGVAFRIEYAGDQGMLVCARAARHPGLATPVDHGYLPLERLASLQHSALLNAFVRSGPAWFQHKVPELLAAGRPILCVTRADAETHDLCRRAGVPLHDGTTVEDIASAVAAVYRAPGTIPNRNTLADLTWDHRAETLESLLEATCR